MAAALVVGLAGSMAAQDAGQLLERGKRAFEAGDFAAARTDLWAYLETTAGLSGPSRLPQADALYTIALMEPDAGMAAQHYRTIVEEYAASSIADEALFRLAQLDLVEGRNAEAREKLSGSRSTIRSAATRPRSRSGPARRGSRSSSSGVRPTRSCRRLHARETADLPQELSPAQREALGARYVFQLARAFPARRTSGRRRSTTRCSPSTIRGAQAAEARLALDRGAAAEEPVARWRRPRTSRAVRAPEPPAGGARLCPPGRPPAADVVVEDVEWHARNRWRPPTS
jgi:hypothetical protein